MEKCEEETEEVFAEDEEGGNATSDDETHVVMLTEEKRQRRVSDVIDSMGDPENFIPEGFMTPRRSKQPTDLISPDQGYSATPEASTPNFKDVFKPDWMKKSFDYFDAAPNVRPDEEFPGIPPRAVASMPAEMDDDRYNMNHKYRGKCIVFNHEHFDTGFKDRRGSSVDAKTIEQTFGNLGFEVEILNDLKHAEVVDKIAQLSEEDHEDADCICIFMLTHGMSEDMICAKDSAYKAEKIWKPFTGDKCKSLAGKPKLFFFQACRGSELDKGVTLLRQPRLMSETDTAITSYEIPTHADFLIAYSSVQGFYSYRNMIEGTWFVQCLCKVIEKYSDTTDLLRMLTITARKIATEHASYHEINFFLNGNKQVPSITTMLLRDLYFTPKYEDLTR